MNVHAIDLWRAFFVLNMSTHATLHNISQTCFKTNLHQKIIKTAEQHKIKFKPEPVSLNIQVKTSILSNFLFKKYSYPGTQYQGGYQVIDTWEDILPYKACFMWKGPVSVHYLRVSHFCSHFWRISKEKFRRLGNFMWQKLHHLQAMYN